jgi:transcriptional regulator with XRE-family HTH domain
MDLLKSIIKAKGDKLSDTASLLGISRSALYKKLNGASVFKVTEVNNLKDYYSIPTYLAIKIFFSKERAV